MRSKGIEPGEEAGPLLEPGAAGEPEVLVDRDQLGATGANPGFERVTLRDRAEVLAFGADADVPDDPARIAGPAGLRLAHGLPPEDPDRALWPHGSKGERDVDGA